MEYQTAARGNQEAETGRTCSAASKGKRIKANTGEPGALCDRRIASITSSLTLFTSLFIFYSFFYSYYLQGRRYAGQLSSSLYLGPLYRSKFVLMCCLPVVPGHSTVAHLLITYFGSRQEKRKAKITSRRCDGKSSEFQAFRDLEHKADLGNCLFVSASHADTSRSFRISSCCNRSPRPGRQPLHR